MKGLKKAVKIIFIIAAVIAAVLLLLYGIFVYMVRYAVDTVDESKSPNGKYTLLLQSVGSPLFFSSADGRLVLKEGKKKIAVHEFVLSDDGGSVRSDVWKVQWKKDRVEATISGSEQADEVITIRYDGRSVSRQEVPEHLQENESSDLDNVPDERSSEEIPQEEIVPEEIPPEEQEIRTGYQAIYDKHFQKQNNSFIEDYNAKGYLRIILHEDDSSVEYLVYDRESANGRCGLYVYYRSQKDGTGAWSPSEASILDIYAYVHDTGDVIRSGKKQWADTGEKLYRSVTGEN